MELCSRPLVFSHFHHLTIYDDFTVVHDEHWTLRGRWVLFQALMRNAVELEQELVLGEIPPKSQPAQAWLNVLNGLCIK